MVPDLIAIVREVSMNLERASTAKNYFRNWFSKIIVRPATNPAIGAARLLANSVSSSLYIRRKRHNIALYTAQSKPPKNASLHESFRYTRDKSI